MYFWFLLVYGLFLIKLDLALTLKANLPIQTFSASFQQTLLIQLIGSSNSPNEREINNERKELSQLDKRASEPSGKNKKSNRLSQSSCKRLSEAQKYNRLESIGGRNQQFTANTPNEAAHNFPSILPNPSIEIKNDKEINLIMNDDPQQYFENEIIKLKKCDNRCQEIKKKLENAINDISEEWDWYDQLNDSSLEREEFLEFDEITKIEKKKQNKGRCILERFIPIGNCTKHGYEEAKGSEKLCTACQGIFLLNRNCFPLFVNSVVCGKNEPECIYDRMSGSAQGKCRPKMLSFKVNFLKKNYFKNKNKFYVMFNHGTKECERWGFEYLEVPVACECYLSKRSIWLEAVPPIEDH